MFNWKSVDQIIIYIILCIYERSICIYMFTYPYTYIHHITLHYMTWPDITSHHITSHHIETCIHTYTHIYMYIYNINIIWDTHTYICIYIHTYTHTFHAIWIPPFVNAGFLHLIFEVIATSQILETIVRGWSNDGAAGCWLRFPLSR